MSVSDWSSDVCSSDLVQINDANACVRLVYVDDVVDAMLAQLGQEQ
jgi:hypothetical protein